PSTPSLDEVAVKSVKALLSCQRTTGYLGTNLEDPDPSWATAPALLALVAHGVWTSTAIAGEWLASWKAPDKAPSAELREAAMRIARIDLILHCWPWGAGDSFAMVEPTALACIALRAWGGRGAGQRIDEGLRYLRDRVCSGDGWNYGTPYFL